MRRVPFLPELIFAACVITVGAVLWLRVVEPAKRHQEFCDVTRSEFESLAKKRPPGFSRKQWSQVVFWTLNGHANMLTFRPSIPQGERNEFVTELRRRLQGAVDLGTIDWIWDEMVRLTGNTEYSDNFRPTSSPRLREFEAGSYGSGPEVD